MSAATSKTDAQLKADVLEELRWDPTAGQDGVCVLVVRRGFVILTGFVGSLARRLAVREAAHRVLGVLDVVDALSVKLPVACVRTDAEIARAARDVLSWDSLLAGAHITPNVSDGVVILEGAVASCAARQEAERAVQRLAGVRRVTNRIAVASPRLDAERVKGLIEKALERQTVPRARRPAVSVDDGVVTITGTLRSWDEKSAIERAAGSAPGVWRVDDRTTVDPYR